MELALSDSKVRGQRQVGLGTVRLDEEILHALVFPEFELGRFEWIRFGLGTVFHIVLIAGILTVDFGGLPLLSVVLAVALTVFWIMVYWLVRHDLRRVALSARGIHAGTKSEIFVPWDAVVSSKFRTNAISRLTGSVAVSITVSDLDRVRLPPGFRRLMSMPGRLGTREVNVVPRAAAAQCAGAIEYYLDNPEERDEIGGRMPTGLSWPILKRPGPRKVWAIRILWVAWFAVSLVFLVFMGALVLERIFG